MISSENRYEMTFCRHHLNLNFNRHQTIIDYGFMISRSIVTLTLMFEFGILETDVRLMYCLNWFFIIILPLIPIYLPKRQLLYRNSNLQLPAAIFYEASPWVRMQCKIETNKQKKHHTRNKEQTHLFKKSPETWPWFDLEKTLVKCLLFIPYIYTPICL